MNDSAPGARPLPPRAAWRRRQRVRAAAITGTVFATLAVATVATLGLGGRVGSRPTPERTGPAATVKVTRQTLVKSVTLAGELGYGTSVPLACVAPGTVTWLPEVGATVRRGGTLLRVDDVPVALMYGSLPMYRSLAVGATGADVRQFKKNLSALGFGGFAVNETFSAVTASAVKRWQKSLQVAETGTVDRASVIYAPGPIRIGQRLVRVGANATGDVLSYTGDTRLVTVNANPGEDPWAKTGTKVTVKLPTGGTVAGTVSGVSTTVQQEGGTGGQSGDQADRGAEGTTVAITIAIADQRALGALSEGPVEVVHVGQERKDVLTVPVNALLALAEGGYGLEVVDAAGSHVVAVRVGLFAEGRVEVSGAGIDVGTTVGVPA